MYLIIVDSYSKWCEVPIVKNATSAATVDICRTFFSRFGLPNQIVTENGSQFSADTFTKFCTANGIKNIFTAPYHQSSNRQAERFVQTIKMG